MSHLYTLVQISFSQIELALRVLNFYSDGTPLKEGLCARTIVKTKENEKIKKKEKEKEKQKCEKEKEKRKINELI